MDNTLGAMVIDAKMNNDIKKTVILFCSLNDNLKKIHYKGLCTNGININTSINQNNLSFNNVRYTSNQQDYENDLYNLAIVAVSSFVFFNTDTNNFVQLNKEVIKSNAAFVSEMIPGLIPDDNYYLDIIQDKVLMYYEDYISALSNQNSIQNSSGNNMTKVYSTPVGRALDDTSSNYDAAFVNIMYYPIIVAALLIICSVIFITIYLLT